jgi:hypothetical protein
VAETVLAGDVEAGDVISLPGAGDELLVERVQLGHGGFLITVSPAEAAGNGRPRVLTLTAGTQVSRLSRRGQVRIR